jgi:hypothetical protein
VKTGALRTESGKDTKERYRIVSGMDGHIFKDEPHVRVYLACFYYNMPGTPAPNTTLTREIYRNVEQGSYGS